MTKHATSASVHKAYIYIYVTYTYVHTYVYTCNLLIIREEARLGGRGGVPPREIDLLIVVHCFSSDLEKYFEYQGQDYICSRPDDNGMHSCSNLPPLKFGECTSSTFLPLLFESFLSLSLSLSLCLKYRGVDVFSISYDDTLSRVSPRTTSRKDTYRMIFKCTFSYFRRWIL